MLMMMLPRQQFWTKCEAGVSDRTGFEKSIAARDMLETGFILLSRVKVRYDTSMLCMTMCRYFDN